VFSFFNIAKPRLSSFPLTILDSYTEVITTLLFHLTISKVNPYLILNRFSTWPLLLPRGLPCTAPRSSHPFDQALLDNRLLRSHPPPLRVKRASRRARRAISRSQPQPSNPSDPRWLYHATLPANHPLPHPLPTPIPSPHPAQPLLPPLPPAPLPPSLLPLVHHSSRGTPHDRSNNSFSPHHAANAHSTTTTSTAASTRTAPISSATSRSILSSARCGNGGLRSIGSGNARWKRAREGERGRRLVVWLA